MYFVKIFSQCKDFFAGIVQYNVNSRINVTLKLNFLKIIKSLSKSHSNIHTKEIFEKKEFYF